MEIKYIKGKENYCADALSRLTSQKDKEDCLNITIINLGCHDESEKETSDETNQQIHLKDLIRSYHDDSMLVHLGVKKTLKRLQQRYSFPKMKASVEEL